jgi:hypothetical protein
LAGIAVGLLALSLMLCLVHDNHDERGVDLFHGTCGIALVGSFFAAAVVLVSLNWWLWATLAVSPNAVAVHLPDPPPKSSALS